MQPRELPALVLYCHYSNLDVLIVQRWDRGVDAMTWNDEPVANGLRTDHPWPNLPFVDDGHIPIEDPDAVEGLGRGAGGDMWGRCDYDEGTGEWAAYTTDPKNHDFAWVLRFHPEHGLSVLLYRDEAGSGAYDEWFGDRALMTRLGGYWWDGTTWYRPRQVMNWATETYMRRPVQRPTVITAADLLDDSCRPERGTVSKIAQFTPSPPVPPQQWRHDLARWAQHRADRDVLALERCVVTLNAPELAEAGLLGVEEFAAEAGIAASTLRAYIARDEAEIPAPQVSDGGRKRWSRPVVTDWLEQRRRDPDNAAAALTGDDSTADASDSLSPALRRLWNRLTGMLLRELWEQPAARRRWARPFRNEPAAKDLAEQLGWVAAVNADAAIPIYDLAWMIQQGVLWELQYFRDTMAMAGYIGLTRQTGHALGWFIEQAPGRASGLFGAIVRDAGNDPLNIPAEVVEKSLRKSLMLDGGIPAERLDDFFAVTFPPQK
uniref:helix-turn-helix transcriptional regulator n=1 Tax=Amycolatopsis sp. CA-293810 TaxID=3239926 RepID=UPI003F496A21